MRSNSVGRHFAIAAAVVMTGGLACGGSGEGLTKEEFIREGDVHCQKLREEVVRIRGAQPQLSIAEEWRRGVVMNRESVEHFRSLGPPNGDEDWYQRYVALLELRYELGKEIAEVAREGPPGFSQEYWSVVTRTENMAKNYGFRECGWELR